MNKRLFVVVYILVGTLVLFCCVTLRPGVYRGVVNAHLTVDATLSQGDVILRAETEPQWYWVQPENHRYRHMSLEILGYADTKADVNLLAGTLQAGSHNENLDVDGLAKLIVPHSTPVLHDDFRTQISGVLALLYQFRDGTAPRPRHHPHSIDSPVHASIQHFTTGANRGFIVMWLWIGAWPLALLAQTARSHQGWCNPLLAYLITLALVVTIDAVLIGIGMAFSPGPISELMEFLLGLLNCPGLMVLGERFFSLAGLVLGALSWATLASMATLVVARQGCNKSLDQSRRSGGNQVES
jgi:hypothetical protein